MSKLLFDPVPLLKKTLVLPKTVIQFSHCSGAWSLFVPGLAFDIYYSGDPYIPERLMWGLTEKYLNNPDIKPRAVIALERHSCFLEAALEQWVDYLLEVYPPVKTEEVTKVKKIPPLNWTGVGERLLQYQVYHPDFQLARPVVEPVEAEEVIDLGDVDLFDDDDED